MQQPNLWDQPDVKCQDAYLCKSDESYSNTNNKDHVSDLSETNCALVGAQKHQASDNFKHKNQICVHI